jgi:hypothetical protein
MTTIEVRVSGLAPNKNVEYEVVWLDWSEFQLVPTSKRARSHRELVSNGKQAFQILRAKARTKFLEEHGYDPNAVYEAA